CRQGFSPGGVPPAKVYIFFRCHFSFQISYLCQMPFRPPGLCLSCLLVLMDVFYLPVDRLDLMEFQKFICLTEVAAAKKSAVGGQRARVRRFQDQMLWIIQHRFLTLCRTPPKHEDDRPILLIQNADR